jgi:hypothetical protein
MYQAQVFTTGVASEKQELLTIPDPSSSLPIFSGVLHGAIFSF